MPNPTVGQYLALEKRVLKLEKFITKFHEELGEDSAEKLLGGSLIDTVCSIVDKYILPNHNWPTFVKENKDD